MVKTLVERSRQRHRMIVHGLCTLLVILGTIIAMMIYSNHWHQQQYFISHIQGPLVELQGILEYQQTSSWNEPQLVSNQLYVLIASLDYGLQKNSYPSKLLSRSEYDQFQRLEAYLRALPNHKTYSSAQWDELSIRRAEHLKDALKEAGLMMNTTISPAWSSFIDQIMILTKELDNAASLR
ncbi:hypothetical protein [Paenibacillus camelliae]|uniref:hypothetical protein n=1 Tax=Paenibacillus camelliae TaxID=512410 RepID=UPI00203DA6C4|nr:hypothetical protein [Paenibacillus camelliae]MCM3634501.1 hypothetical protein [Paenibacillus camelliae]